MRILHTSDWHVGRTFHGVDLLADQERTLAEIAALQGRTALTGRAVRSLITV